MDSQAIHYRIRQAELGRKLGWSFTPLSGKRPVLWHWQIRDREPLYQALRWARQGNIGIRCGAASGIIGIDVDPGADATGLDLPPTVTVLGGREGSKHLYYRMPTGTTISNSAGRLAPHIDVRGEGGQLVFVGSIHPDTGRAYQWAPGCSPAEIAVAELPQRIINLIK